MNFMVRSFAALLCLLALAFVSTPAAAQEPELRAYPEIQVGLWKTIATDSNGGITFVYTGGPAEACWIQHQSFNPLATYVGSNYISDTVYGCSWIRFIDGGPPGSNTTLGTNIYFECPYGYRVSGGL